MAKAAKAVPAGFHTITPQLVLDNAAQAIEFYKKAFGAQEVSRHVDPDGKIMHAHIKIGDSFIMMNDVMMGAKGPRGYGGSPASLWLYVDDCDAVFKQAIEAGGTEKKAVQDQFYGDRSGTLEDPFGHIWTVATHKEDVSPEEIDKRLAAMAAGGGSPG